jgi:hypothetical protein
MTPEERLEKALDEFSTLEWQGETEERSYDISQKRREIVAMLTGAVAEEKERCAVIAELYGEATGYLIAEKIRAHPDGHAL